MNWLPVTTAFVTDRGDWKPRLAVGRLPAGDATELSAMVARILAYPGRAETHDWRSRIAWVSDANPNFQAISDRRGGAGRGAGILRPHHLS